LAGKFQNKPGRSSFFSKHESLLFYTTK